MPARNPSQRGCHRYGLILTCYVDGRKRFRPLALHGGRDAEPDAPAIHPPAIHPVVTRRWVGP